MSVRLKDYHIPFLTPYVTSAETYSRRSGFLICWNDLISEVAPLPGFSTERIPDVIDAFEQNWPVLENLYNMDLTPENWWKHLASLKLPSSLEFGADMIWWQKMAKKYQEPLWKVWGAEHAQDLKINATISSKDWKNLEDRVRGFKENGFETVKLKIGVDWEEELKVIKKLKSLNADLTIRVDANGAWDIESALEHLAELADQDIEFCEQPVVSSLLAAFLDRVDPGLHCPVAADEALVQLDWDLDVLGHDNLAFLMIKPMVHGGPSRLLHLLSQKKLISKKKVFTSSLDSGIGQLQSLYLCMVLGSKEHAHGFSTTSLLKHDLLDWISPTKGEWAPQMPIIDTQYLTPEARALFKARKR